ncbi:hypothetical protein ACA910_007405 [Epithemia clementina (nom. ined.)]
MYVEGQTQFRMAYDNNQQERWTIQELVVTRTFTEWEKTLLLLLSSLSSSSSSSSSLSTPPEQEPAQATP